MSRVWLIGVLIAFAAATALAQDPVKLDPKHYKVEFENDRVRVLRVQVGPHEKTPMHEHADRIAVFLTDHHVRHTLPDGKTGEHHATAGQAVWSPAVKHAGENLGDQPFEILEIELKTPAAAKPASGAHTGKHPS